MSEKKTMTLADQDVGKATALTAGVSLLMADAAGNISKIDADRLMELFRESVKISGRNLISKSVYSSNIEGARLTKAVRLSPNSVGYMRIPMTTGGDSEAGDYALSFWVKSTGSPTSILVDVNDAYLNGRNPIPAGNTWTFYSGVAHTVKYGPDLHFIDIEGNSDVIISDIVLVKGNVPLLQWTPAPEDLAENRGG